MSGDEEMLAWQVHRLGEPGDVLQLERVRRPQRDGARVRIAVSRVSLNHPDVLLCRGHYQERPEPPFSPGMEIAGRIIEDPITGMADGTPVIATPSVAGGGLREEVLVEPEDVFPIPASLDPTVASVLLFAYHTGHVALHHRAKLSAGETLLVHGGAGGLGSAAIQLGVAAGARVIATASTPEKARFCRNLGAELVIEHPAQDLVSAVKEATGPHGVDVIYDPVGGEAFTASKRCIAFEGRLVVVGFASGQIPSLEMGHALVKNYSVIGIHWALYRRRKPALVADTHRQLLSMLEVGSIHPVIEREVPFDHASQAISQLGDRAVLGKIVVRVA